MKLIPVDEIQTGMVLGKSIFEKDNRLLLGAGFRLVSSVLPKLAEKGISYIYIMEEGTEEVVPEDIISNEVKLQASSMLDDKAKKIEKQLNRVIPDPKDVKRLMRYLEKKEVEEGEYLMRQGDQPDEMYFIEAGLVSAQLELPDGKILRLRSIRGGTTVGEMGMYLGNTRTASVVANRKSVVYRLSKNALNKMEKDDPKVAALLHHWIARLLAERLADNNRTIEALLN